MSYVEGPDNIYYNVNLTFDPNGPFFQPATYNANKTIAILNKSSDYYCSVIRFNIPLDYLPVTIMPIVPNTYVDPMNPGFPNLSTLSIGIRNYNTGISYEQPIIYSNPSGTSTAPIQDKPTQVITPYYYIYSYFKMIEFINTALAASFAAFAAANPADPRVTFGGNPVPAPYFVYDPVTSLIRLITFKTWINNPEIPPNPKTGVYIYINTELENFLDGFTFFSERSSPSNLNFFFVIKNRGDNGYPVNTYPAVPDYLYSIQTYSTIGNWQSIKKIIITSASLPIVAESLPLIGNTNDDQSNFINILSDFLPQINSTILSNPRENAIYFPSSQYRLIDMISDIPLKKIQLSILWEDKDNNLYPVYLSQFSSLSLKLAFVKKSLYKNSINDKK